MVMLSITRVTLTPLSDGKGHAGTALQHSHAGGYELLLLIATFYKGYSHFSLFALGLGVTYVYKY